MIKTAITNDFDAPFLIETGEISVSFNLKNAV